MDGRRYFMLSITCVIEITLCYRKYKKLGFLTIQQEKQLWYG